MRNIFGDQLPLREGGSINAWITDAIWKVSNPASINDCEERAKPYAVLEYVNL